MPEAHSLRRVRGGRLLGPALWAAAKVRVAQWDARLASPRALRDAQERILLAHTRDAASTEFGRTHRFAEIRSHADFVERVPLRTYAEYEPMLERMRRGERDVLHRGFVDDWGQSSGSSRTAAKNKFLPISKEQIRWQQRAGFDVLARYLTLSGDRQLASGYMLGLFPPSTIERVGPVGVASNPGIMQRHVPFPASRMVLPKVPIRDIAHYETKLRAMADAYLDHDVRSLTGTTCWFSVFFDHVLDAARRRGRHVDRIDDVWPNLRVLLGGGVPAQPYRRLIEERVGRPVTLLENYSATEGGFFATADDPTDPSMLVIPDRGVFFELVPRAEADRNEPRRVPLWDVETAVDYSVVLTTSSGLFAYTIGDYVRFTRTYPHRLEFVGRPAGVLSLTQELTSTLEIERAVAHASDSTRSTLVEYAASSEVGVEGTAKGRYLLFVEFEGDPPNLGSFGAALDDELCAQNRVYREHRADDVAILAPRVVSLPRGATRAFMRELGQTSVQQKFPRILDAERTALLTKLTQAD